MKKQAPKDIRFAALATDVVLFAVLEGTLKALLIDVNLPSHYKDGFGLPGGLILADETAEQSVERHMKAKVGITPTHIEQLYTFSSLHRDPRNRVVSVAYIGLVTAHEAARAQHGYWKDVSDMPKLAFDHGQIVEKAVDRLKAKLGYTTIVRGLLPAEFALSELQAAYEAVLQKRFDKRNFRKKILSLGFLKASGKQKRGEPNRPSDLYAFKKGSEKSFDIL